VTVAALRAEKETANGLNASLLAKLTISENRLAQALQENDALRAQNDALRDQVRRREALCTRVQERDDFDVPSACRTSAYHGTLHAVRLRREVTLLIHAWRAPTKGPRARATA
jgi:hypothetical protein